MENEFALHPSVREYYLNNRFIHMTEGRNFISHDDFCEKHNFEQKKIPKDNNFEQVCSRSKHLQAASQLQTYQT